MEPVSLTVSAIGLAALFSNAVDCFEYIKLGRNFGTHFQSCLLKLDNARLRLSRWGQAAGLSGTVEDTQPLQQLALPAEDILKAGKMLRQVLDVFADAEGVSTKFKTFASPDDSSLSLCDEQKELNTLGTTLHEKMRALSVKRQNRTHLPEKAKWALYEEKHFRRLIEDITELVNGLIDLVPSLQIAQRELCEREVAELGDDESLPILKDIAKDQDKDLEEAISNALERAVGVPYDFFANTSNTNLDRLFGPARTHSIPTIVKLVSRWERSMFTETKL
jgi:hypothetical protein